MHQQVKELYEKPVFELVELRPEERAIAHCKKQKHYHVPMFFCIRRPRHGYGASIS